MAQIASIDWAAKRFYLHADTVVNGFDAWAAFTEIRLIQQANLNGEQGYKLFIHRQGKAAKGGGKFTPRYCSFDAGWRAVPYDGQEHNLEITVEMVSDDQLSDRAMFDRAAVAVNVDIDSVYDQVETIEKIVGSGLSTLQDTMLTRIHGLLDDIENGESHAETMRLLRSALVGKVSDAGTGVERFRDRADTKDRIVSTNDESGNRTSVVVDAS